MCHPGNKIRLVQLWYKLFPILKDTVNEYIRNLHEIGNQTATEKLNLSFDILDVGSD